MTWEEYLPLSEKTLSLQFNCNETEQKILHSVIGIMTELDEILDNYDNDKKLDKVNILEEVGDICWYLAILGREYDISFPQITVREKNSDPFRLILSTIKMSAKLLDMLKKKIYYNKDINQEIFVSLSRTIMMNISDFTHCYDIQIEKSFQVNIDKLRSRYGDKFSSESAINRDLNKERDILEEKNK